MDIKLSSFKRDHGLKELLSDDKDEFWHTDDNLPHYVEITFSKLVHVSSVQLTLVHSLDDSYTPANLEVRCGVVRENIQPVLSTTLVEPEGIIPLCVNKKCFFLQIVILSNHQEGRDTHVRNLKIFDDENKKIPLRFPYHIHN